MTTPAEEPTDEQKTWVKKQMGSVEVVNNNNKTKSGNGNKKSQEIVYKYSSKGQGLLRESIIRAGIPNFMKKSFNEKRNEHYIGTEPFVEEATKKLRPPFIEECPYTPYEFKDNEEPNRYLQRALRETVDSLYQKIKNNVKKFNDIHEKTTNLLSANVLGSYFQDRLSTVHYLFVVGDNGTGKSAFGDTFECLGYRAVNITNATEAFWFRMFGTNEPGQVTIIAEEVDKLDESGQVMAMLKQGYQPNAKVPRMNNENTKMDFYYPFGLKVMIRERSLSEDKAKGLLDRSFKVNTYKGSPKYKIKEIRNPQGNAEKQRLLDEINDLRKLLLMYRLIHFKDPLKEVDVGLDGRDEELCKPLLQLFYSLGASEQTQKELEETLKHFLDIKNERKEHSIEALVYPIIANLISQYGKEISTAIIWTAITNSIEGSFDKYVGKNDVEYVKNPNIYHTDDYDNLNRNTIISMIRDKFGAELKHKENGNVLIFNVESFIKIGKIYGKIDGIQTKLIEADAPDAPDALAENDTRSDSSVNTSEPPPQCESGESGESANSNTAGSKKVKCPECDYVEHPFYMKLHRKNTGH